MSRTDKTKPFWVKLMHGDLEVEELHDHCDGPCDLPGPDVPEGYWRGSIAPNCRRAFVYTGIHVCCCAMCHGDAYQNRPGKRQRLESRRMCREWQREY